MNKTLEQAARAAGLSDMTLLKVVDANQPPEAAVAQLRQRYPRAFPMFNALSATKEEVKTHWRGLQLQQAANRMHTYNQRSIARISEKYGDKK
ncbi:hypothetical protein ACQ5TV_05580 [Acetobacter ghanensis]|uniref:hypothetical protein n=1 Tax=Acetobacter ghanensis TaxID=431306 RepID=UPI003D351023